MSATFRSSEGLRQLLTRVNDAGPGGWQTVPEVEELMEYTIRKYRPLAAVHHCEPEDSAFAAFEAMRTRAVRIAADPWAVVTRAVQVSLIAEERANGLLCSPGQARRAHIAVHHDARRLSDSESDLLEFHPAFFVQPDESTFEDLPEATPTGAFAALDMAVGMFVALGWPLDTATAAMDCVAARLVETGSRSATHTALRRDPSVRALLDLDRSSWTAFLRIVLGNPDPDERYTAAGHGLLLRFLVGHSVVELLADDQLVWDISKAAPATRLTHV